MAANYLQQRGNAWFFYRRVPLDLVPYLGRFWRRSLHTPDRMLAATKARELAVETDRQIADSRKRLRPLTVEDQAVIRDYGGLATLRVKTLGKDNARYADDYGIKGEIALAAAAAEMLTDTASLPRDVAAQEGINLTEAHDEATDARTHLGGVQARYQRNIAILSKDTRIRLAGPSKTSPFDQFATSPARQYAARRFTELFPDLSLPEITRQHGVIFVKELARLPSTTSPRVRKLPLREAIALADREDLRRLDRATVRQNFFRLSAMMNDAANDGVIKVNPLQGYKFPKANGTKHAIAKAARRKGFTPAELRQLDAASDKMRKDDRWIFLLGAYQGARREECAQLRTSDIRRHNGLWCMEVTDAADGQRVKN